MLSKPFFQTPIAHRTLHDVTDGRPENSLVGAKAALDRGYGVEIDLQLSKDNVPMVFHDYFLERLTNKTGAVAQRTAKELGEIELKYGNEGIPTFSEFLQVIKGQVPILVEIKDQDGALGSNVGVLEKATCDILLNYDGDVALMSFNPNAVAECAKFAPNIARGLVTERFDAKSWPLVPETRRNALKGIPDYDRIGASFISHNVNHLSDTAVLDLKERGAAILCWTVRSEEQEKKARQVVQNITFEGYLA